jgi:hypothetical protein
MGAAHMGCRKLESSSRLPGHPRAFDWLTSLLDARVPPYLQWLRGLVRPQTSLHRGRLSWGCLSPFLIFLIFTSLISFLSTGMEPTC